MRALAILDAAGMPYAEAWRLLRPVAARLGVPRPSYPTVRRALERERRLAEKRAAVVEQVVVDLLRGVVPRL